MRRFFWLFNKFFMVPMFLLGFGPFMGNPLSGYIMVLKTIGRKTAKLRYTPVNYAIHCGRVYCLAGYGRSSDWYRNLHGSSSIEIILPGGTITGMVQDVLEPAERELMIRQILKNGGFAGFFEGFNPYRITDEELLKRTTHMPLICIQPAGLGSGRSDPGGWAWVWVPVSLIFIALAAAWLILR